MKHKIITVLLILFIFTGISVFADTAESDLYVKTIYIVKVYNDNHGFRVDYQNSNMKLYSIYMPQKWFGEAAGYGEVVYGNHPSAPYMSVWYKEGKVDHFRLYVKEDFNDPSWGTFPLTGVNEDLFQVEELTIIY
ncbi:hypothetical protein [Spirochaeta isovalerica]|uniref:Uncharacterized protein n=1 Tax=Spirochaeta isovalerica TaxID=150 RepID=A0A841RBH7_9SPIO|nr:hypothetical protein [Spirochaeta isovalerica]MBB6481056.1 hypothetical protein [Spirochaeta isovalerica]